jgi:hypothetical protein
VSQNQKTLRGKKRMQQAQPVEQNQSLATPSHTVHQLDLQFLRQTLPFHWQIQVCLKHLFLVIVQQILAQLRASIPPMCSACNKDGRYDSLGAKLPPQDLQ